ELWPRLMPAVLLTLMARTQHLLVRANPGGDVLAADPYDPSRAAAAAAPPPATGPRRFGNLRRGDFAGAWESLRRRLRRSPSGDGAAAPALTDERTVAQLQAVSWLLG